MADKKGFSVVTQSLGSAGTISETIETATNFNTSKQKHKYILSDFDRSVLEVKIIINK